MYTGGVGAPGMISAPRVVTVSPVASAVIAGLGVEGYLAALRWIAATAPST